MRAGPNSARVSTCRAPCFHTFTDLNMYTEGVCVCAVSRETEAQRRNRCGCKSTGRMRCLTNSAGGLVACSQSVKIVGKIWRSTRTRNLFGLVTSFTNSTGFYHTLLSESKRKDHLLLLLDPTSSQHVAPRTPSGACNSMNTSGTAVVWLHLLSSTFHGELLSNKEKSKC